MTTDHYSEKLGDKYKLKFKEIGHGGFGIVYKGKNNEDRTLIAAKKVKYSHDEAVKNACKKELEIFQKIKPHQNIVQLLDHIDDGDSHWFIMELGDLGNLKEYLQKFDLVFSDKLKIMFDCASAICHLHTQNPAIVHRDIKPANVLMQTDGHQIIAKISDFGVSKKCYTNQEIFHLEMNTRCGTPGFVAPEWFDDNADLSPSTDIFSLGLLFQVLYLYDEGTRELHPLSVDSRRSNKLYHYGLEMKHAKENNNPMPTLFSQCDFDPCYIKRLQKTITYMTKYEEEERMKIQTVKETLQSIVLSARLRETGIGQLIYIIQEDQSRKLKATINQDVRQYLEETFSSNDRNLVVVSMIGLFKTGKSSLLNMWAGLGKHGFDWKDGEDSCTSGVWVYCLQQDDKDIILLDCQGTHDARSSDPEIDVWISLFSMLSSSVLVFNKLHNIDQSVFDILHCMHSYVNSYVEKFNYPELCLLIRDFTLLEITHTNDDATLESHFIDYENMTSQRDSIKKHFKKRKCFKLPLPSIEPMMVKEWSFGNGEISQKFQNGAKQMWDYITQEASYFSIDKKAVKAKEWAMKISDIASCLDYTVSDLRPVGEKVSINMTVNDIQWMRMRRLEECLDDKVKQVQMLKETFEKPITDIETCMLDGEQVNTEVEQLCKEVIEHMEKYSNGLNIVQLVQLKHSTKKVKENMKTVYSCLHKIFISLFSVRNSKNFGLLMQMSFPQLSEKAHKKLAEFITRTVTCNKCNNEGPDLSVIQTSGQEESESTLRLLWKSVTTNLKTHRYKGCILADYTALENFLKDQTDYGDLIDDIMECFRSFFFREDLSGLPRMLAAIHNSDEWTPWMKNMIQYNLQNVLEILTDQQFSAAACVLRDISQENRELTRCDETQEIEPTWGTRIETNLPEMNEQEKEQVSCILKNVILMSQGQNNDRIQGLLQDYFTASINSSNAKAVLIETIEILKKQQSDGNISWNSFSRLSKITLLILVLSIGLPFIVKDLFDTQHAQNELTDYFKCQHEMSSTFISHLSEVLLNAEEYVNFSSHKYFTDFHIYYKLKEAIPFMEDYLNNNFLPIEKLDPVMKLIHYILLEDCCNRF